MKFSLETMFEFAFVKPPSQRQLLTNVTMDEADIVYEHGGAARSLSRNVSIVVLRRSLRQLDRKMRK